MILTFFRCIPLIPLFTILALSQSFSHWPVVIIVSVSFWIASVIILFYVLFLCLLHQFLQNLLTRKRRRRKEKPFASCIPIHIYIYKIYPPPTTFTSPKTPLYTPYKPCSISRFDFAFSPKSPCILHRKQTTSCKTKKLKVISINNNRTKEWIFIQVHNICVSYLIKYQMSTRLYEVFNYKIIKNQVSCILYIYEDFLQPSNY